MKLGYSKTAAATPAFALIAEGWNELVQEGLTPDMRGDCPVSWTNSVIFAARDDGEIVGVVCYNPCDVTKSFVVSLGYVEPTSRKQGVFRELWAALVVKAKEAHVARVVVDVSVQNSAALAILRHLGVPAASCAHELILGS